MPTNRRTIVFSEPFARIKDNRFYICAEDIDGLQWELIGPLADVDFAQTLRHAFVVFEDGWAYLEDVREALNFYALKSS